MEIVDMGITKFWISGPKSRSVNNFSQRSDFGLSDQVGRGRRAGQVGRADRTHITSLSIQTWVIQLE
jgi:hypothetical protein